MAINENLIELAAAKSIYEKCWKQDFTSYKPETIQKKHLTWLNNFYADDTVFNNYSDETKQKYLDLTLEVEKKIPMISEDGTPLTAYYRVYIASEMAKVLLRRSSSVLEIISSVVVYRGLKLRRSFNEGGLCLSKGFKRFYPTFLSFMEYIDDISNNESLSTFVGPTTIANIHKIKQWKNNLTESTPKDKKNNFIDLLKETIKNLKSEESGFTRQFEKLTKEIEGGEEIITEVLNESGVSSFDEINEQFSEVKNYIIANTENVINLETDLLEESECSLHISILSHFSNLVSDKQSNLIVHELAHAIDFEYEGFDGIPSSDSKSASKIVRKWVKLYEEAKSKYIFLKPYAFTNHYEFFAVTTEQYFRDPQHLQLEGLSLYNALKVIYGNDQGQTPKWSQWKLFKTLCFSKLRFTKIT